MESVTIKGEFIKLDSLLKYIGIASTGGEAKLYILDGLIGVNGEICTQRGKKIRAKDIITFNGKEYIIEAE